MRRLGIDIGGVIINGSKGNNDTSFFGENYLNTPPVEGALEAISELHETHFNGAIWLVSKCSPEVAAKSRDWLDYHYFYGRTGLRPEKLHFTPTRIGKTAIAVELGLTDFIDDRLEVLSYMVGTVPNLHLINPDSREVAAHKEALDKVSINNGWDVMLQRLQFVE